MELTSPTATRVNRTRERLRSVALDLFEERGYHGVTVDEIAAAAGVSHMTFFRHFRTKAGVLTEDPFDPTIGAAVAAQPEADAPIDRVVNGLRSVLALLDADPLLDVDTRRAIRIMVQEPDLQAAAAANSAATAAAIGDACSGDPEIRVAAAACMAAISAALNQWARGDGDASLRHLVEGALAVVRPGVDS